MDMVTYLLAKKHGGGGSGGVKWDDIQDRPFYCGTTEAPLDIQWDGASTDGKTAFEVGAGSGMFLVKLSDTVLTQEQLKQCWVHIITPDGEITAQLSEEGAVVDFGVGLYQAANFIMVVYDAETVMASEETGLPAGAELTNGVWTMWAPGMVSDVRLWSETMTVKTETTVPIPNKYISFVDVTEEEVAVLEEQAVEIYETKVDGANVPSTLPVLLTPGKTYRIIYDGTEYILSDIYPELAAESSDYADNLTAAWSSTGTSNVAASGSFLMMNWKAGTFFPVPTDKTTIMCPEEDHGTHTIAIYDGVLQTKETVKIKEEALPDTLPETALPSGIWYPQIGQEQYEGEIIATTEIYGGTIGGGRNFPNSPATGQVKEGDRVVVVWDGVKFETTVTRATYTLTKIASGEIVNFYVLGVGDLGFLCRVLGGSDEFKIECDYPVTETGFVLDFESIDYTTMELNVKVGVSVTTEEAADSAHTITAYAERAEKLPEYFMPELPEIILRSSTDGSSKKFKITIDDNGQLTPTEIT